ncbi:ATP-binding cassette domain-containing protein [Nonomuraea sp. NPDC050328]|uniref:ATP-binding cassette domain-containing protein n=1 Tax=Nonomuraea sp. NPDC050328 TaxID=3364361 RepID=UPI003794782D
MADRLVRQAVRDGGPWPALLATGTILATAAQLALPALIGSLVDAFAAGRPPAGSALVVGAAVALAVLGESLAVWARGMSGARASARIRQALVRHVLGAGPALTRRLPPGEIVTRAGLNAEELGRAPEAVVSALSLLVPTAGAIVALALLHPLLALALLGGVGLIVLVLRAFARVSGVLSGAYQEAQGEIAARLADALAGARTIAAARSGDRETRRILQPLPRLRAHGLALWRAGASAGVRAGLMVPLVEVAVLVAAGFLLASGRLTVGEVYAAARYAVLGAALSGALGFAGQLARARAAAARVEALLAVPAVPYGTASLPAPARGTLTFRGVRAAGLEIPALTLPGGSLTAVVGRSGAGKSLVAALAGRLADPDEGQVLLDGTPLPELSRAELRRAVGYAFERPVLVGASVAAAIELGGGRAEPAARAARADAFVRRLPHGYGTPLAQAPMSGGERQRLGLARAFAHAERLLILDDATSSLDSATEALVNEALTGELGGRTRLVVTHRPDVAARADLVVWLDGGRVRRLGPHRELWHDPGYRAAFDEEPR